MLDTIGGSKGMKTYVDSVVVAIDTALQDSRFAYRRKLSYVRGMCNCQKVYAGSYFYTRL